MIRTDTLTITPEILNLIAELDEFKGVWRVLRSIAPERLSAMRRVATIESVGSSTRIEGSRLSDREVERLLSTLAAGAFANRDEQEVAGYAAVMDLVFEAWDALTPTENHIRQLHRDLLVHSEKDAWHRGSYKTAPNNIAAFDETGRQVGVVFETATPFDTPARMRELTDWFASSEREQQLHPLLRIGLFVVILLEIHPFQDGNGRLSRILTTLLLLRSGYAYVPYSSLESVVEQSKDAYYRALRRTQATIRTQQPDWNPWLVFFLRTLQQQMRRLAIKIERETLVSATLPELSRAILDHVRSQGRITIGQAVLVTNASRNTLKPHFRQLVARGQLALEGKGRGVWYRLP